MKYVHTNLTVMDLDKLSTFYQEIFGCVPVREADELSGQWLEGITGVEDAAIRYIHLRLPGYGDGGSELELIQYLNAIERPSKVPNASGFGHLAFAVEDVHQALARIIGAGGGVVNKVVTVDVPKRGRLTEVYATDPEGNIIELQHYVQNGV